jgi:hypothetical protein
MAEVQAQHPLDEMMLAMDVVDTLRHRELLVARELAADDRDRQLIQRLQEIYAAQGIVVPERVLEAGVQARRENRFAYEPPKPSLTVTLAKLYIERGKWAKWAGVTVLASAVLVAGYVFLVALPSERRVEEEITQLNKALHAAEHQAGALEQDVARLQNSIPEAARSAPELVANTVAARAQAAKQALFEAEALLHSARELPRPGDVDPERYRQSADAIRARVARERELVARARGEVEKGKSALVTINALRKLPPELVAEREAARANARVAKAEALAEQSYASGLAALRAGDVEQVKQALAALRSLREQLALRYTLEIVSRSNEYSGVWRVPDRNPNARNYYIIVEAMGADGQRLTVPVVSEEDGQTHSVAKWGIRVDERVFKRVAADKQDDGIVQNRRFGVKRQGYLEPEYLFPTSGAAIVEW